MASGGVPGGPTGVHITLNTAPIKAVVRWPESVDYDGPMRLLERDAPLATLAALRTEAQASGGRLVFVEGEAGVGKTSLLAEFRRGLPPGVRALLGSCDPLSTP